MTTAARLKKAGFLSITAHVAYSSKNYLAKPDVSSFVLYLRSLLANDVVFRHAYVHRKPGYEWQCRSMLDALVGYRFPIDNKFSSLVSLVDIESITANALCSGTSEKG